MPFGSRERARLVLTLLGVAILVSAFLAPWWTRGFTIDWDEDDNPRSTFTAGIEGVYHNYGPFRTPSGSQIQGLGGDSVDSGRETAVAILGIGLLACTLFVAANLAVRWMMATGRLETDHSAPVYLAIGAFIAGVFTVLWAAFFLPLAGPGGGMLYGEEPEEGNADDFGFDGDGSFEVARYANAGFFLGIVGAVGFPAYLWADAARTRALAGYTSTAKGSSAPLSF